MYFNCAFLDSGFQYSQKEDKYEEEIKVLTDKLKEVRVFHSHLCYSVTVSVAYSSI